MAHQQHRRAMILVLGFLLIFLGSTITSQLPHQQLIVTDHLRGKRAVLVTNSDPRLPCRYYGHRYLIFITLFSTKYDLRTGIRSFMDVSLYGIIY